MNSALFRSLEDDLRTHIAGEVRFDEMTRGLYSTDASIYQIAPVGVVFPQSADDVRAVLDSYGWVDANAGTIRLPIQEAMKLFARKHAKEEGKK